MNPNSLIKSSTACIVSGDAVRVLLRTCDTVDIDTLSDAPHLPSLPTFTLNFECGDRHHSPSLSFGSESKIAYVLRRDDLRRPKDNFTLCANSKFTEASSVKTLAFFAGDFTLG